MSVIDFMAARAVAQARLLENSVHDRGPWSVQLGDTEAPACRVVTPSRVVFLAYFSAPPGGDLATMSLLCRGELASSRDDIQVPASGAFFIEWAVGGAASPEQDETEVSAGC